MPSPLYLCLHLRDFAAQALGRFFPELRSQPVAVLAGGPPLATVFCVNQRARSLGVKLAMSRVQAESFGATIVQRELQKEESAFAELVSCAQKYSPRMEVIASPQPESSEATLVLDVSGSERLLGKPERIAAELHHSVCALGYEANVVSAQNVPTAVLASRGLSGAVSVAPGHEAEALASLPLSVLGLDEVMAETFSAWGLRTLGELATLPTKELIARVGERGFELQALAQGCGKHLLAPEEEPADAPLCENVELEHPVELLEPLLFLLNGMLEKVVQRAAQRALAIASVETCLVLAGVVPEEAVISHRQSSNAIHKEHRRTVRPTLPERDRHTLLKLIQLDLELHPPKAAVIALRIMAQLARPQRAQYGLFSTQAPESGRLEVLLAHLRKLVGEDRVGTAELLDSLSPEAFRMASFSSELPANRDHCSAQSPVRMTALRMVRPPRAVHIELRNRAPAVLHYEGQRLRVRTGSGPWRTNGAWWTQPAWSREEWEVELDEQPRRCLRLAFDPGAECWYVIGIYD